MNITEASLAEHILELQERCPAECAMMKKYSADEQKRWYLTSLIHKYISETFNEANEKPLTRRLIVNDAQQKDLLINLAISLLSSVDGLWDDWGEWLLEITARLINFAGDKSSLVSMVRAKLTELHGLDDDIELH